MISDWLAGALGEGNTKNGLIESNWFTMASWRFEVSLIVAAVGACLFFLGMKAMIQIVGVSQKKMDYQDALMGRLFSIGAVTACVSEFFIHVVMVIMPILYKELYETSLMGADIIFIEERFFHALAVPYYAFFFLPMILISVSFGYMILTGRFRITNLFLLLNPLVMYGLSFVFKMIRVVPVADFGVALVSFGYVLVFLGGILQLTYIVRRRAMRKKRERSGRREQE